LLASASLTAAADEAESRAACTALTELDTARFRVDTAEWVGATNGAANGPPARPAAPAHCLFRVTLDARPSSIEGVTLGTGFELRLPLEWNGRFLFQGGGGLNGSLNAAFGSVSGAPSALERGFAVVSTDGGHRGRSMVDSSFAVDQQAKLDFAYQAVQRTTYEAKDVIDRFYGELPEYSYFMGCSTGGREAMLAAQRLPLEFDGVVAGDPAFNLTRIAANQVYSLQTVTRIAPRGDDGQADLSQAITDTQLRGVADAVTAECDALDGLADGMINDFLACEFEPASLQCGAGNADAAQCLAPEQVRALSDIFDGAKNSRGESLYGAFTFDTGIADPSWRSMHLGSNGRPPANASLGSDTLRLFAMAPARPDLDPLDFDFDSDMAATAETAAINDAIATLHSSFAGRGGKLIVYHGLSDQGMSAGALIDWYSELSPRDAAGPQDWARLFFVPGMAHCSGGQSTDSFDMLTAIQDWVEIDTAPDSVTATGRAFPGVTRPLCPFPAVARYDGGDPDSAASFTCR
jgi:feruloyl esterase